MNVTIEQCIKEYINGLGTVIEDGKVTGFVPNESEDKE